MVRMKKGQLVKIDWVDASHPENCMWWGINSQVMKDYIKDTGYMVESVGWIIHYDKNTVIISPMMSEHRTNVSHIEQIPRGCIKKIKLLK